MAGFEACICECNGGVGGDGTGVELLREVEGLDRGRERQVDVAGGERGVGAVEEVPGQALRVVHQPCGCDRVVEHLGGLCHPASNPEAASEHRDDERKEIALLGRTADPQRTLGVRACPGEVLQVELGRRQMRERVEPFLELVVGETVDQDGGVVGKCLSLGRVTGNRARERTYGERRCEQWLAIEQRCRIDRAACPGFALPCSRRGRGCRRRARS